MKTILFTINQNTEKATIMLFIVSMPKPMVLTLILILLQVSLEAGVCLQW